MPRGKAKEGRAADRGGGRSGGEVGSTMVEVVGAVRLIGPGRRGGNESGARAGMLVPGVRAPHRPGKSLARRGRAVACGAKVG